MCLNPLLIIELNCGFAIRLVHGKAQFCLQVFPLLQVRVRVTWTYPATALYPTAEGTEASLSPKHEKAFFTELLFP